MALEFILGRSGSEFGHYILNEITEEIKQDPQGDPIFIWCQTKWLSSKSTISLGNQV